MEDVIPLLKRIASAFEEQNRQTASWIALQTSWHEQGDPNALRILAMHEEQAAKDQAWRDLNTRALERFLEEQREVIVAGITKLAQEEEDKNP